MLRIAIIGAGIAGLNAALTLQDAGLASNIYEAAGRIGGRIHSNTTTWAEGLTSEWCGEFIGSDHQTIHQLIKRFGLQTVDLGQARTEQGPTLLYFCNRFYDAQELARDWQALAPLLQQQVAEVGFPTIYTNFTQEGYRLDQLSVSEWIAQYVQGGQQAPLGRLLTAACRSFYGLDVVEQSALNLLTLFGAPDLVRALTTSSPLQANSKIVGGNAQLPLALARSLPPDCIHLHHHLHSIARNSDTSLTLTFTTPTGSIEVPCDHAILTIPFSTLRHLDYQQAGFDALKHIAIQELGYGTISKLFLQFDRPYWYQLGPWPHPHGGFLITDLAAQTLWDASLGQTGTTGLLVAFTSGRIGTAYTPPAAYCTTDDTVLIQHHARSCLQELEQILPGISKHYTGRAALSYPTGDPFLRGSYSCYRVGQYTRFAGYEGVQQGPVHFAGEHCSTSFQGFMEGAAREGARAAREILHHP